MVGAGFGGLELVKALSDTPVDVVLVDSNNFHTFQPLLYQVATAGLDSDDIAHPVRGIVAGKHNVDVRMGRVVDVDLEARRIGFQDGPPLPWPTFSPPLSFLKQRGWSNATARQWLSPAST